MKRAVGLLRLAALPPVAQNSASALRKILDQQRKSSLTISSVFAFPISDSTSAWRWNNLSPAVLDRDNANAALQSFNRFTPTLTAAVNRVPVERIRAPGTRFVADNGRDRLQNTVDLANHVNFLRAPKQRSARSSTARLSTMLSFRPEPCSSTIWRRTDQ